MADAPSSAAETALRQRERVLFVKLDLARDLLTQKELEQLRSLLSQGPLPPPFVAMPRDEKEKQRLETQYEAFLSSEQPSGVRYRRLLDGLDEVFSYLSKQDTAAAKERATLLSQILADFGAELAAHNAAARAMTENTRDGIVAFLTLDPALAPFVETTITQDGPLAPPPGAPQELAETNRVLQLQWEDLLQKTADAFNARNPAGLRQRWLAYRTALDAYETACASAGRKEFLRASGLPEDMTEQEFAAFQADLFAPLVAPKGDLHPAVLKSAQGHFATLEKLRAELSVKFPLNMRHGFPEGNRAEWGQQLCTFMMQRSLYETGVQRTPSTMSKWLLYAGIVVNEVGEEFGENMFQFSQKSLYERFALRVPFVANLDAAARARLFAGWDGVVNGLKARGVPAESLGKIFGFMGRTPMGPKFWGELLKVESPLTVLLWGAFMYSSEDKVKAAVQFGSFIAVSNASNMAFKLAEEGFRDSAARALKKARAIADPAKRAAALQKAERYAERMKWMAKGPANPALKFAMAMGLAIGLSSTIDYYAEQIDKAIPDSETKHDAEVFLSIVSSEALIGHVDEALEAYGVFTVNPLRDQMEFLGDENILAEGTNIDRMRFHTIDDWNARVDQAIAAERGRGDKANVVAIAMFELQKIQDPETWAQRQSVELYAQSASLRAMEAELGAALAQRGVIGGADGLNAWAIATADGGDARNDRELEYALGVGKNSPGLKAARAFFDNAASLPAEDPLREQWKQYVALATSVAKAVSVYRNLGLYRSRAEWLGSGMPAAEGTEALPEKVMQGMYEEMAYRMRFRRATDPASYPNIPRPHFDRMLAEAMRMKAHDEEWNKLVSTGVALGGSYALFRMFKSVGSQGRFAQSTFAQFLDRIPGVGSTAKTLNGIRRTATYPFTRVLLGPTPAAPGVPEAPRRLVAKNPDVELRLKDLEKSRKISRTAADSIRRSSSAQKIMSGAMQSKNAAELDRCIRSANRAVVVTRSVAAVGMVGDAFGVYMAYVSYQELGKKIELTENPALKDVYEGMQQSEMVVGGVSLVCLTINGVVFITGAAGGLLAVASVATLPIGLALAAGKFVSDRLYEVAETWSKNGLDWAKELDPTGIMRKLIELAPGEGTFWQGVAVLGVQALDTIDGSYETTGDIADFYNKAMEKKEVSNHMTRVALLHAYFIHTLRLKPDIGETEQSFKRRTDVAISDAMRYMLFRAGDMVTGANLDNAVLYAELCDQARLLRRMQARGDIDEAPRLTWLQPDGTEAGMDLSKFEESVSLFAGSPSPKLPAGFVIEQYRRSKNAELALFLNESKPSVAGPLTAENLQMTHQFIQGQLLDRLEPYINRFRGKLYEYYDGISVSDMSNLGKKEILSYVLYQQIRYRLAGDVQALLQKKEEVTPEDMEAVFQKMAASLTPSEGMNRKFDGLLEEARRTHLGDYENQRWPNKDPLTPANLRSSLLWDTSSYEFQRFAMSHPWLVGAEVVSKDMFGTVFVLERFIGDELRAYATGSFFRVARQPEFRFLMSYAAMLDRNPDYDPDGSARALIRGLDRPEFQWTGSAGFAHQHNTDRTHALIDVLKKLKTHVRSVQSHREYFVPPDRDKPYIKNVVVAGQPEKGYSQIGGTERYVMLDGYRGADIRITKEEALHGKELRNPDGTRVGVMWCEEKQWREGGTYIDWWLDVSTAEAPATFYVFQKGQWNGREYERNGVQVTSRSPERTQVPILADGSMTFDMSFFYKEGLHHGYRSAWQDVRRLEFTITEQDGTLLHAWVSVGYHTEKDGRVVPDAWILKKGTTESLQGYSAQYLTSTASGRPSVRIVSSDPKRMLACSVTYRGDVLEGRSVLSAKPRPVPTYALRKDASFTRYLREYTGGAEPPEEAINGTQMAVALKDGTVITGSIMATREGKHIHLSFVPEKARTPGKTDVPFADSAIGKTLPLDFLRVAVGRTPAEQGKEGELTVRMEPKPDTADVAGYDVQNPKSGYHARAKRVP